MKTTFFIRYIGLSAVFLLTACAKTNETSETNDLTTESAVVQATDNAHHGMHLGAEQAVQNATYKIGDELPKDQVCMVNNAYMGKKQFEVPFEGKMYYGCCNMCVERIPNDESARVAIDPFSKKKVDKSEAYIVLVDQAGTVSYFENEANYHQFLNM